MTIPVAKLWWAAAVVFLSLIVTLHPYVLLFGSGQAMKGEAWWIVVFSVVNVITTSFVLRHLFRLADVEKYELSTSRNALIREVFSLTKGIPYVLSCFIPVLGLSWVVSVGTLVKEEQNIGSSVFVVLGLALGLVVLGLIHIVYNGVKFCRDEPRREENLTWHEYAMSQIVLLGGYWGLFTWNSSDWWWAPVVVLFSYVFLYLALAVSDDEEREQNGRLVAALMGVGCCLLWFIPHAWYATIYTVAEFATYHDMPAVVNVCLPDSPELSLTQRKHMGERSGDYEDEREGEWAKNALKYAVQHGDAASAFAYLRSLDSHLLKEQIDELGKVVNLVPLSEELLKTRSGSRVVNYSTEKELSTHMEWSDAAVEKQVSFDEPSVLAWMMNTGDKASFAFTKLPEYIAEHNAKQCAVFLIHREGCNATYGFQGREETLLQAAIERKSIEIMELLLKNGADPDFAKCGETPRQVAERMKWPYAIKWCRELRYEAQ